MPKSNHTMTEVETGVVRGPITGPFYASANIPETTDAAGNTSTTYSMGDDDVFQGTISTGSDTDWIEVTLADGAHLIAQMASVTMPNTTATVSIYDSTGSLLASEEYYTNTMSAAMYYNTTGVTQTVYIQASSFSTATGDYEVTALIQEYEVATYDEIAEYLTNGWFGMPIHWDVDVSDSDPTNDSIYVDITTIGAAAQSLALTALEAWTFVTGIQFITADFDVDGVDGMSFDDDNFDDDGDGDIDANDRAAFAGPDAINGDGIITSATVTVTDNWLDYYGTGLDDYSFLTYMHEIGHALGLIHGGPYNGSANYSTTPGGDNVFVNDTYLATIMSYFDHQDWTNIGSDDYLPVTPMIADILAARTLYGVDGSIRTGDTTYGAGSTAGGYYDSLFSLTGAIGMTIVDDGGTDLIDLSFMVDNLDIDLAPGAVSSLGSTTNNFVIFETTLIENLTMGSGDDMASGNAMSNLIYAGGGADEIDGKGARDSIYGQGGDDTIYGGDGKDYLVGGSGNDTIDGGLKDDRINGGGNADTATGGAGDDNIYGNGGQDNLSGNADDDRLVGGGGHDTADGGDGDDFITTGRGRDTLIAGDGIDTLIGGADKDTFVFDNADDTNTITDFQDGIDKIGLAGGTFGDVVITPNGGDAMIVFGSTVIILENVSDTLLTESDFVPY